MPLHTHAIHSLSSGYTGDIRLRVATGDIKHRGHVRIECVGDQLQHETIQVAVDVCTSLLQGTILEGALDHEADAQHITVPFSLATMQAWLGCDPSSCSCIKRALELLEVRPYHRHHKRLRRAHYILATCARSAD